MDKIDELIKSINGLSGLNETNITNVAYAVNRIQNHYYVKEVFNNISEKYIKLDTDKKKMQKIIGKEYVNFIQKHKDEVFEDLNTFIKYEDLERIILFAKYNKNLNNADFVKAVKKSTLGLIELIVCRHLVSEEKINLDYNTIRNIKSNDGVNIPETSNIFTRHQFDIILATIDMIKAIKYDYNNSSISYFDKNNKVKKTFKSKQLCIYNDAFYFITKNKLSAEDFESYLKIKYPLKDKYSTEELEDEVSRYCSFLEDFNDVIDDEYAKLILDENYKIYTSNRIDNPSIVFRSLISKDTLFSRKVLLPKNGVLLLIKDNDIIESILLKEVFKFNCNNIVAITKFKDGKELVNIFTLDEKTSDMIHYWIYKKESSNNTDINPTISYIVHFLHTVKGSVDDKTAKLKYEVISPTYWKYRDRGYKSENDTTDHKGVVIRREFEVEIAPFLRKINGAASSEAQILAKKLGIVLEDGYTIVKPHTRHYNTKR